MAEIISIPTFTDDRGELGVFENILPRPIQRVFYIKGKPGTRRGGKSHHNAFQCMISLEGSCQVHVINMTDAFTYELNTPNQGLILSPGDWHEMSNFTADNILLILSTEKYNPADFTTIKPESK